MVVEHFLETTKAPAHVVDAFHSTWPEIQGDVASSTDVFASWSSKTVLLTYIGEWGLLPAVRILDNETEELRPWRELVDELRATDQVKQLWTDFQFVCKTAASYLNDITWTCCFEVCMQTYEKERKLRIHGHLFLRRPNSKIVLRGMEEMLKFHDTTPKPAEHLNKHTRSAAASWQGAFYCQCPKIGSVFSAGTIQPFTGYPVNGDWVFTLVQQEKIEYVDAKELIVRSGRAVGKRLQDLNAWRQAHAELASQAYVQSAQIAHAAANKTWRIVDAIETWREENTRPMMRRKKFLVLVGPTGLGKTEFVKGMFGAARVLELNAAGMLQPCLRQFHADTHVCILWDEAEAILIAQNRKLFQCPACFVELGFSPTGAMTYTVMVNKSVMVVCSNRWEEQLKLLDPGDRDWILGNSVVVKVDEPLWVVEHKSCEGEVTQGRAAVELTPASSSGNSVPDS